MKKLGNQRRLHGDGDRQLESLKKNAVGRAEYRQCAGSLLPGPIV